MRKGSLCELWNFSAELGTEILKRQLAAAFEMQDVNETRCYLDALAIRSIALSRINTAEVMLESVKGRWVLPKRIDPNVTMLYLHGGGYAFYPKGFYNNLTATITMSAECRMFALDYRLAPEHKFPAQLEDAANAYQWLLSKGVSPKQLVIGGDSAGGNLALALLLFLRDSKLPLPALAVCLSPATDFAGSSAGVPVNSELDWINQQMALKWTSWFCSSEQRSNPMVSPVNADLRNLPPIYIQAGGAEILLPSIQAFVEKARQQGANVSLETWPGMNHDFQGFGYDVPQSAEAIQRIGEVIKSRVPRERKLYSHI
jgi:acetyl esterase/lipase